MPKKVIAVAKKIVAKKPPATKKKADTKKTLVYAPNKQSFWVNDGRILNSLLALESAMSEMEKAVFVHHVNKEKHDFADWVDTILCDSECAADLRKAKTPTTAHSVVKKHLKSYQI